MSECDGMITVNRIEKALRTENDTESTSENAMFCALFVTLSSFNALCQSLTKSINDRIPQRLQIGNDEEIDHFWAP